MIAQALARFPYLVPILLFLLGLNIFALMLGNTPFIGRSQWRGFLFAWSIALMMGSIFYLPFRKIVRKINKQYPKVPLLFRLSFQNHGWALLIPLPLLLYFLNDNLFYANDDHADPWYYYGLLHWFNRHGEIIPDLYFATRIPAILPGYFFYSLLPGAVAHWCNSLLFYYLSVLSIYGIVKRIQGPSAGLLIAFLFGTFNVFLATSSTDYVTPPAIAFILLSMYFTIRIIDGPLNRFATVAGFFCILAIWCNLAFLVYIPCLVLFNLWALIHANKKSGQAYINWTSRFLMGVLLATGLCAFCNYAIADGRWFFFTEHFVHLLAAYEKNFSYTGSAPLVIPAACGLGIILSLIVSRGSKISIFNGDFPAILFVLFVLEMILLEFYGGYSNLQHTHHLSIYLPLLFVGLSCFLNWDDSFRTNVEMPIIFALVGIAYFAIVMPTGWPGHNMMLVFGQFGLPFLFPVIGIVLHRLNFIRSATITLALIFVSQLGAIPDHYGRDLWFGLPRHTGSSLYDRVHTGIQFVLPHITNAPRFWFNQSEDVLDFIALQRSFVRGGIGEFSFPKIPMEEFQENEIVVLLSKHGNLVERARKGLEKQGLGARVIRSEWIYNSRMPYEIVIVGIQKEEARKTPCCESLSLVYDPSRMRAALLPVFLQDRRSRALSFLNAAQTERNMKIPTQDNTPIVLRPRQNISVLAEVDRDGDYSFFFRTKILKGGIWAKVRMSPGQDIRAQQSVISQHSNYTGIELITFLNAGRNIWISLSNAKGYENSVFILDDFRIERY